MSKTFEILNFGHWDLPFDSFDLEALDRFAQDREPVERPFGRLVEPLGIRNLMFGIYL